VLSSSTGWVDRRPPSHGGGGEVLAKSEYISNPIDDESLTCLAQTDSVPAAALNRRSNLQAAWAIYARAANARRRRGSGPGHTQARFSV
jgi:hypothetical protein